MKTARFMSGRSCFGAVSDVVIFTLLFLFRIQIVNFLPLFGLEIWVFSLIYFGLHTIWALFGAGGAWGLWYTKDSGSWENYNKEAQKEIIADEKSKGTAPDYFDSYE